VGVTLSDSVLAYWTDAVEGKRFALDFMLTLWRRLHPTQLRFRGFLDIGECVDETSVISHVLSATDPSFLKLLPSGLAAWSVTVAEASHFPDGLFVSERLSTEMRGDLFEAGTFHAGPFQYRKVRVAGQTAVSAPTGLIR